MKDLGITSISVTVCENEHQSATFTKGIPNGIENKAGMIEVSNESTEKNCLTVEHTNK